MRTRKSVNYSFRRVSSEAPLLSRANECFWAGGNLDIFPIERKIQGGRSLEMQERGGD